MTSNTIIHIRNFAVLALVQVLIFSQIHLFGYATASIYLIFLLKLPRHTSRNEQILWGFLFGLTVDIFCNTPGINAAAATAMGFIRGTILNIFTPKAMADDFTPDAKTLKWGGYIVYSAMNIAIFYTILFFIELFTVRYPATLLLGIASSTILTMLFVIVIESFSRNR